MVAGGPIHEAIALGCSDLFGIIRCVESAAGDRVAELARERPGWLIVLKAATAVAEAAEPHGGRFAGRWVLEELSTELGRPAWLPGLRLLVGYGLIEKSGESTRGGSRAYYRMPHWQAIRTALDRLNVPR